MKTRIEWTEYTWNPITGCSKISPGCKHCYAERMAKRLKAMNQPRYSNGFALTLQPEALDAPLRWKKPSIIFVNSMSDMFHKNVPLSYIQEIFEVMGKASQHTFQILTKRSNRLLDLSSKLEWRKNIWIGVSVENEKYINRIYDLENVNANVRFLSLEPLLGPLNNIPLEKIDWVIVGGESGPGARPMQPQWCRSIRDQCNEHQVPFFFKQWGGVNKKKNGRLLDGRTWDDLPDIEMTDTNDVCEKIPA
ncbi:phage Gp37/Gp68 family protein [bacterium]|nr:phage Gp37/Gp68 family protein [bacterium]